MRSGGASSLLRRRAERVKRGVRTRITTQLHKEAEEAKKKVRHRPPAARWLPPSLTPLPTRSLLQRLEEEAAQVYEEFVAAFNGDSPQVGTKAFVRGGVVEPGSRPSAEPTGTSRTRAVAARVSRLTLSVGGAATGDKKLGTRYVPSFIPPSLAGPSRREEKPASVFDLPARTDKSKPRVIDSVLEELQRCARCVAQQADLL